MIERNRKSFSSDRKIVATRLFSFTVYVNIVGVNITSGVIISMIARVRAHIKMNECVTRLYLECEYNEYDKHDRIYA